MAFVGESLLERTRRHETHEPDEMIMVGTACGLQGSHAPEHDRYVGVENTRATRIASAYSTMFPAIGAIIESLYA